MLSDAQLKAREGKLTASRIGILMSGDPTKVMNLWREMVGDPTWEPEDLSDNWPVYLGSNTEKLHLDWLEKKNGISITRRGEVVIHPKYPWGACTLDGYDATRKAPIEAKHVNNYSKIEDVTARYTPQITWQMLCTEDMQGILSVIVGANEPVEIIVPFDAAYATELESRAVDFMKCVETLTPPVALAAVAAPVAPEKMRTVDMTGNNAWTVQAGYWLETKEAAAVFEAATKEIKALVEPDVRVAHGAGIVCSRSKSGSLTIRKEKS